MIKCINETNSVQQILFSDGSALTVYPGKSTEVLNSDDIRPEEIKRIKKFFRVEEIKSEVSRVEQLNAPSTVKRASGISFQRRNVTGGNRQ